MTKNEKILYTYIIRILFHNSNFSYRVDISSPNNKFLSGKEIINMLHKEANSDQKLKDFLEKIPSLTSSNLDTFLSTVLELEYPKAIEPSLFGCDSKNSEGKTLKRFQFPDRTFGYAVPKKINISAPKEYESNDFLVLLGMVLTPTEDGDFKVSDLKKSIQKIAKENTPSTQAITRIAKKLCHDVNIKKLGFFISYNERKRANEELTFSFSKIFDPFEASMLADMLKTYPYYSAEFANELIKKLQFFDENGIYSFDYKEKKYHSTPNIPTLIDTSIRGSFRLTGKECDQFLCHIVQLKDILRNKHKAIMTYGERIIHPDKDNEQTLAVRETTIIHPHELVWANGYYYFVATPENSDGVCEKYAHNYRVDRIINLEEVHEYAKPIFDEQKDFSNGEGANFSTVAYRGTHNMMVRGDIYTIKLKCKNPLLSHVLDCFGTNTKIKKLYGKEEGWFEATFRSTLGGVAYGVTQYMDECIVLEPKELRDMVFKNIATGLSNYKDAGLLPENLDSYFRSSK